MQAFPRQITRSQIAVMLGVTERHARRLLKNSPRIYQRVNGGRANVYIWSALPDDIRAQLTACMSSALKGDCGAGACRAKEIEAEAAAASEARRAAKEAGLAAYEQLPRERQAEAATRREILRSRDAFLAAAGLPKKQGTLLFIREYKAGTIRLPDVPENSFGVRPGKISLSWATLHRWEKAYEEEGLAGLASGYKSTRGTFIPKHMQDFLVGLLVKRPHIGIPTAHQVLSARFDGQDIPSRSAVRRFLERWRTENANVFLHTTSPDKARDLIMPGFGLRDEQVTRLNQLWEFDSTPGDVMLADGRHSLIGVIDVYSRRAKIHVSPTSKSAAIAALNRRAMLDWGVEETAKTDNGADYTAYYMERVFEDLEIEHVLCRPFCPDEKPHIERFFKTFLHGLFELLPGFIGHNVAERKEIEARRSFVDRIMDKDAGPVEIKMTSAELQKFCDRWCDAVYHQNVHGSLNGKTPAQMAREWKGPVRRIKDERALDILLCPAPDSDGMRVIHKKGIRIDHAWFFAAELAPFVRERVFVLLDHTDYGTIYVYRVLSDGKKEFLCRAVNPDRTGHDRSEIASIGKAIYNRVMREGSSELKKVAQAARLDHIENEVLNYMERQKANVLEFQRPSEEYTTPAMQEAARVVEDVRRAKLGPCPIPISPEEETAAAELIDMAQARRESRPLPATPEEKYEQLCDDLKSGIDVSDSDLAFMKRFELWLETGASMAL